MGCKGVCITRTCYHDGSDLGAHAKLLVLPCGSSYYVVDLDDFVFVKECILPLYFAFIQVFIKSDGS